VTDLEDEHIDSAMVEDSDDEVRAETEAERIAEALVFASAQPVSESFIADRLPRTFNVRAIMVEQNNRPFVVTSSSA